MGRAGNGGRCDLVWAFIVTNRRKTILRNRMMDDAARRNELWALQYQEDQRRYRRTYQIIAGSPEIQAVRNEVAQPQATEQIAKESGITFEEAAAIYHRVTTRKSAHQLGTSNGVERPRAGWRSGVHVDDQRGN